MNGGRRQLIGVLGAVLLAGCAGIQTDFEAPTVTLSSFRMLPSEGLAPRFLIGLRVVNRNRSALKLNGLSYDVDIEGHRLLTGVRGNLARIPPYAESEIEIEAATDLLGGLRLINQLLADTGRDRLSYNFRARLDVAGMVAPLRLDESGELSLAPARQAPRAPL